MERVNAVEPQECVGLGSLQRQRGWRGPRGWEQHPPRVPAGSAGGMRALVGCCDGNGVAVPGGTCKGISAPGKSSRRRLGGGCSPRQPDFLAPASPKAGAPRCHPSQLCLLQQPLCEPGRSVLLLGSSSSLSHLTLFSFLPWLC